MSKLSFLEMPGKLRHRLLLFFGLASLIPLLIMMGQGYHCAHRAIDNAARAHLFSFAQSKKKQIETWIKERLEDIHFIAQIPCLQDCCCGPEHAKNICNIVQDLHKRLPEYEDISVLDIEGRAIIGKNQPLLKNHKLYNQALKTTVPVFGPIYYVNGIPKREILCSILDRQGKPFRLIWCILRIDGFVRQFLSEKDSLGKTGRIILLGEDYVIGSNNLSGEDREHISQINQEIRPVIALGSDVGVYPVHHGMIGAYALISAFDMIILVEISRHEAMAELELFIKFSLATAGFALICTLLITIFIARKLTTPILKIAFATQKIARGDLKQKVIYRHKDEIGMLVENFNVMGTQLEVIQKRLVQTQALAATGKVVAGIVHEIRNPLSSVKMNLQILMRRPDIEEKYRQHGDIALQQLSYLENLLAELLDFSRPVKLQRQKIEIEVLVKEVLQTIAAEIAKKQIKIHCELRSKLFLLGDRQRIKQVLCNLVLNAIQASQSEQQIIIRSKLENDKIYLEVIDYGKGIEDFEQIFQPFYTTKEKGTGLGLSHAKKIIELHEGNIMANSSQEQTCFTIILSQAKGFL